ncbi:hypothetical protein DSECCO2_573410 [anaerobic digester metagenome]
MLLLKMFFLKLCVMSNPEVPVLAVVQFSGISHGCLIHPYEISVLSWLADICTPGGKWSGRLFIVTKYSGRWCTMFKGLNDLKIVKLSDELKTSILSRV